MTAVSCWGTRSALVIMVAVLALLGYGIGSNAVLPIAGSLALLCLAATAIAPRYLVLALFCAGCSLNVGFMLGGDVHIPLADGISAEVQVLAFGLILVTATLTQLVVLSGKPRRLFPRPLGLFVVLFLVWCAASVFWSSSPSAGIMTFGNLVVIALAGAAVALLVHGARIHRWSVARCLLIAGALSLVWSLIVAMQGRAFTSVSDLYNGSRLAGSMGANAYAFFMLVTVYAALSLVVAKQRRWRQIGLAWIIVATILIALTVCRAAWIAAAVSVLGFAIAGRERRLTKSVIVVLAVAIALAVLPESLNRFTSGGQGSVLSQILSSSQGLQLGTWQGRVDAWEYLLTNYFWKNPMVGTGLGSTAPVFRGGTAFITGAGAPHSEYVRFLCETGVVGVLLFCATLGAALAACWRAARTDEQTAGFARAAFGAVLALTVVSVSDNTVQLPFEFAAPIAALVASATTRPRLIAAGQAGSLGVEQAPAWAGSARLVRTRGKS